MAASLLALGLDPDALHAVRPEPPARAHRARLAARDRHPGELAGADADLQGEEASSSPTTSTTACSPTRSCRRPTSSSTRRRWCPSARTRPPTSSCRARSSAPSTRRYGDTFPEPQAVFTEAPDRARHRRRPEDEQVGRQHDRRPRPAGRHPQAGHVDGHRHEADPAHRPRAGPRSATSASSSAPSATTTRSSGRASGRPGPAASTRRSVLADRIVAPLRRRPRALPRADGRSRPASTSVLEAGAERIRPMAEATMAEVREKMGLR